MSCLTCGHTMQRIAAVTWWCPRCGSIRGEVALDEPLIPKLVLALRRFREKTRDLWTLTTCQAWYTNGIEESINKEVDRA